MIRLPGLSENTIATESAIAPLNYAFNVLKVNEVYASADCENIASNQILKKIGLQLMESCYYENITLNVIGTKLLKEEFWNR